MNNERTRALLLFHHMQRLESAGERFTATVAYHDHILDAAAQLVRDGDAWLHGEAHARPQLGGVARSQKRRLVYVHTNAVAKPVAEGFSIAGVGDHRARGGVGLLAGIAGPQGGNTGGLRPQHQLVDAAILSAGIAKEHRSPEVVAVAIVDGAKVE